MIASSKLTNLPIYLTYDDVLIKPGYADFSRQEIDVSTQLTKKIQLKLPLVAAPMDTVCEAPLAIELARKGGVGVIHRNLTIEDQVQQVSQVIAAGFLVGAAIGAGPGFEQRAAALVTAKVSFILIDSAHGFAINIINAVKYLKQTYPDLEVIAGNVATYEGAAALAEAGADAIRVGMGPGAICTTRIISGMGVPQLSALAETVRAGQEYGVPIIADGGIKYSGDMVKALAIGASSVMMGGFFAACVEAPGEVVTLLREEVPAKFQHLFKDGDQTWQFKSYRGMGSVGAMAKGAEIKSEDEFHGKSYGKDRVLVAEGVEALVPIKGSVAEVVDQAIGGIKSGLFYIGCRNFEELQAKAEFIQITQASLVESHPHDLVITNAGKNY